MVTLNVAEILLILNHHQFKHHEILSMMSKLKSLWHLLYADGFIDWPDMMMGIGFMYFVGRPEVPDSFRGACESFLKKYHGLDYWAYIKPD